MEKVVTQTESLILRSDLSRWVFPLARARLEAMRRDAITITCRAIRLSLGAITKWCLERAMEYDSWNRPEKTP